MKQFNAEVSRVLHLVIHSLYTNKDVFIRELISNASDACEKLRYLSIQNTSLINSDYKALIQVIVDKENGKIIFKDNGIGMDEDDLINSLGTIAKSGTREFSNQINSNKESNIGSINDLIGQFGVGFYSCFMVSDKVEVRTKKIGNNKSFLWSSDGISGYEIVELNEEFNFGTEITVYVKESEKERYLDRFQVENIIKTYSNHISFPIEFQYEKDVAEEINPKRAIWLRNKNEITEEEYDEFYQSLTYLSGKPLSVLHHKIEGNIEYTSLLLIPSTRPFDLFHPDRITRLKLYVKHVFINEKDIDILPKYLRFIYGVLDVNDLPLNVSRETLQDNNIIKKIKDSVVKKIINELKDKAKNSAFYDEFWKNFGSILKEGLCESLSDRESLLNLTRFYTTQSIDDLISLDDYISRMKVEQKEIYYAIGEKKEELLNLPEMEIFKKNNIEVILFNDVVDSFWLSVVHDYKGKDLKNITRADIDFSAFKNEEEKKIEEEQKDSHIDMTKKFMDALQGKVAAVKITTKLTESPACLSINPGNMDSRMEKFLMEQNQLNKKALKVLEINPNHHMIQKAYNMLLSDDEYQKNNAHEVIDLIFNMTLISHGEQVKDPNLFIKQLLQRLVVG